MHTLRRLALASAPIAIGAASLASGVVSIGPPAAPDKSKTASPPMPPPVGCSVLQHGVEAIVNYQDRSVREISGSTTSGELIGANWHPEKILVQDGRRRKPPLSLDANGFAMVPSAMATQPDYFDEAAVATQYYRECEEILRRATGAALVIAFDHNVRSDTGKALGRRLRGGSRIEGAAALVHNDYSASSAQRRLDMLAGPPSFLKPTLANRTDPLLSGPLADDARAGRRRWAFINVWRPLHPVESKPLGAVDAATVSQEELVPFVVRHEAEGQSTGGIYFASHRDTHAWWYFPRLTPDEVLLVKQWDSHGGVARGSTDAAEGRATFALHSAFADPATPPAARDRESIEVRCVLVY